MAQTTKYNLKYTKKEILHCLCIKNSYFSFKGYMIFLFLLDSFKNLLIIENNCLFCLSNSLIYKKWILNSLKSMKVIKLINLINNIINFIFISKLLIILNDLSDAYFIKDNFSTKPMSIPLYFKKNKRVYLYNLINVFILIKK